MAHDDVDEGPGGARPRRGSYWRAAVVAGIVVLGTAVAVPVVYGSTDGPERDTPAMMGSGHMMDPAQMAEMMKSGPMMQPGQMMSGGMMMGSTPMMDSGQMAEMMKSGRMMNSGPMMGGSR